MSRCKPKGVEGKTVIKPSCFYVSCFFLSKENFQQIPQPRIYKGKIRSTFFTSEIYVFRITNIFMCVGLEQWHPQCGHLNSFVIVNSCQEAFRTGTKCVKSQCSLVLDGIAVPPTCVDCYRKVEETICDVHDQALVYITRNIERINRVLENVTLSLEQRQLYERLLNENMSFRNDNREERAQNLAHFRFSQGVWGDG